MKCLGEGLSFFARRDLGCQCSTCEFDNQIYSIANSGGANMYYQLQKLSKNTSSKSISK